MGSADQVKYGLLCKREGNKQLPGPKLLALASEFNIDLRLREFRACGYKVTLRAQFHTMNFIAEAGIPAKRQDWILTFSVKTWLRVRRNDYSFPGWPLLHGAKHSRHLLRRKAEHSLPRDLCVLELQHNVSHPGWLCDA